MRFEVGAWGVDDQRGVFDVDRYFLAFFDCRFSFRLCWACFFLFAPPLSLEAIPCVTSPSDTVSV